MHHCRIYFRWRPQLRDAGDELVLELAARVTQVLARWTIMDAILAL